MTAEQTTTAQAGEAFPHGEDYGPLGEFLRTEAYPEARAVTVSAVERPRGGMSWETFFLTLTIEDASGTREERVVAKRAPGEMGPLGPFDARKDAVIFGALYGHVPVPRLIAHTSDPEVFQRPFTVTSLVEGESDDLYRIEQWAPWQEDHRALGDRMVDVLAAMRRFDWASSGVISVLGPRGSSQDRVRRMIDWYAAPYQQYEGPRTAAQVFWTDVASWLKEEVPFVDEADLVMSHGDFRFGNMIWDKGDVVAVIDWERGNLSDPMSDLGFLSMPMARRRRPDLMGMALTFDELLASYERATGIPVDLKSFQYYVIFWQFIEGSLQSRPTRMEQTNRTGGVDAASRRTGLGTLPLGPNLHVRQTAHIIEAFQDGRHDVV